jgi:hypothetical protein
LNQGILNHEIPECVELLQAVNDYARRAGFATGYPTFRTIETGAIPAVEAVLLRGPGIKEVLVTLDDIHNVQTIPRADYRSQDDLLNGLLQNINRWSKDKGYQGALATCYANSRAGGTLAYEVELLYGSSFLRKKIDLSELGDLSDVKLTFRQAHAWAVKAGFVSALPTFNKSGKQMECVVVRPGGAAIVEIPISELALQGSRSTSDSRNDGP